MDKEMMEKLGNQTAEQIQTKLNEAKAAITDQRKNDLETAKTELKDMVAEKLGQDSEFIKNMQTQLDTLEGQIKSLKKGEEKSKTFKQQLEEQEETLEKARKGENITLSFKDDTNILVGDYEGSQNFDHIIAPSELQPGIAHIPTRQPFIRQIVNTYPTDSALIYYTEQTNANNQAKGFEEGNTPGKSEFSYKARSAELQKFGHYVKVSREALSDYSHLQNELRSELIKYLQLEFDRQLGFGDTGSGDKIDGVIHLAKDFDSSQIGLENQFSKVNRVDVLRAAIAQVMGNHFTPDAIILSPGDSAQLDMQKDDNGAYIIPPFTVSQNQIQGVQVITNAAIENGSFLIGEFAREHVPIGRDMTLEMYRQNEDDPLTELVTLKATIRAAMYVRENDRGAFVSGTFANGMDQLNSGSSAVTTTKY